MLILSDEIMAGSLLVEIMTWIIANFIEVNIFASFVEKVYNIICIEVQRIIQQCILQLCNTS